MTANHIRTKSNCLNVGLHVIPTTSYGIRQRSATKISNIDLKLSVLTVNKLSSYHQRSSFTEYHYIKMQKTYTSYTTIDKSTEKRIVVLTHLSATR